MEYKYTTVVERQIVYYLESVINSTNQPVCHTLIITVVGRPSATVPTVMCCVLLELVAVPSLLRSLPEPPSTAPLSPTHLSLCLPTSNKYYLSVSAQARGRAPLLSSLPLLFDTSYCPCTSLSPGVFCCLPLP